MYPGVLGAQAATLVMSICSWHYDQRLRQSEGNQTSRKDSVFPASITREVFRGHGQYLGNIIVVEPSVQRTWKGSSSMAGTVLVP